MYSKKLSFSLTHPVIVPCYASSLPLSGVARSKMALELDQGEVWLPNLCESVMGPEKQVVEEAARCVCVCVLGAEGRHYREKKSSISQQLT